jgi:hypothetical protein
MHYKDSKKKQCLSMYKIDIYITKTDIFMKIIKNFG